MTSATEFAVADVTVEVTIDASPERVWHALTVDVVRWWPKDFYTGESPRGFQIEPRLGGTMAEDWGGGQGLIWATVTGVRTNELLQLSGELTRQFGGPARTITIIRLEETDGATRVTLNDSLFGSLGAQTPASMESGWKLLLVETLKPFVESGAQPELPPTLDV